MSKKAFSLIEVVIATSILSLSVFGVYRLIWENIKLMNRSDIYLTANHFFPSLQECIKNTWFDYFKTQNILKYFLNFGSGGIECIFSNSESIVNLDNIEYTLQAQITSSGSNFIDWNLSVQNDDIGNIKQSFLQIQ